MSEAQYNPKLFAEFFDWQPQAFVWLQPVWDEAGESIIDFVYVYSNEVGLKYLNLSRDMLQKIRISNTPSLSDEMRSAILAEMVQVYTSGETAATDLYNPVINKYARVYRIKFRDGVLTTIQDKTEERRAILQLNERTKELQRSNESLEEFAYAASHDLQEPLRKITSFLERLRLELAAQLTSNQQSIFDRLQASAVRMKRLIDDLLAYSHVSTKQEAFKTVDLNKVVQEVLQDLEGLINETGAVITIGTLPQLKADPRQMRQLFQNLISNAIKYRKKQDVPEVTVQSKLLDANNPLLSAFPTLEKGTYHLLEVVDNGIGFDQQFEQKIFQAFQRLHNRSEYEGTGIGLAIVQKVVANHKGIIKAISSPGNGATFQVLLPVNLSEK